ncbi:MAG: Asp23/Gls24 family envelope stress response protein [Bacilli bacterium]|nr:Asp23/Gls24 family envelope stress response protein [Bacilli bacterium]
MAQNEYYTFNQGTVNGRISMNVRVFDILVKETVSKMENVRLDASKGFSLSGTKTVVSCSIKENDVYIEIHVKIKYGVKVSQLTKSIQENISNSIKELTGVTVTHIDIVVDDIDFD